MDEAYFDFCVDFRGKLNGLVGDIRNANQGTFNFVADTNAEYRRKIRKIRDGFLDEATKFGVDFRTRHCECSSRKNHANGIDYIVEDRAGKLIEYPYSGRSVYLEHLDQTDRFSRCPCSPLNKAARHSVIVELTGTKGKAVARARRIAKIFSQIYSASEVIDRSPRSAIREPLLAAILLLNDEILSLPIEAFIKDKRSRLAASRD